jgi:hypothetical protein
MSSVNLYKEQALMVITLDLYESLFLSKNKQLLISFLSCFAYRVYRCSYQMLLLLFLTEFD